LNFFTGNTYAVDNNLNLTLVEVGADSSQEATNFLNDLIGPNHDITVERTSGTNRGPLGRVELNFGSFNDADYGKVDRRTFNLGTTLIHELYHASTGQGDYAPGQPIVIPDFVHTGPAIDKVNSIRRELNLPERISHQVAKGRRGRSKFGFTGVNPEKPKKVHYVRRQ
jgi:hypothetical protein